MVGKPSAPQYLRWLDVPISFDRSDHPSHIPRPKKYPLVVSPIVDNVKLSRVFVDGGSIINILILEAFDRMGLSRSALWPCAEPFHGIVPGTTSVPVGQITLLVIFGTKENFRTEHIRFEVVDFSTAYNAFLGRPALTKFMAIPHYTYLVLKMSGPQGVISVKGDVK